MRKSARSSRMIELAVLCILMAGCGSRVETRRESVGLIASAEVVPTSFNEVTKTAITCEHAFCVVRGTPTVALGREAFLVTFSDGSRAITWESSDKMLSIRDDAR